MTTRRLGESDPLLRPGQLQRFFRAHNLPPLDRFGQHFLVDGEVLAAMVAASETDTSLPLIEIGAGLGVLTRALAHARELRTRNSELGTPQLLVAVELDRRFIPVLIERVREFPYVRVVHADILKVSPAHLLGQAMPHASTPMPYDVIGNIPYNITAPILRTFLAPDARRLHREPTVVLRPRRMTLLVDDAVAEAIAAKPPAMSIRAVSVQAYAEPTIVRRRIPPSAFVPPPAVHSAILSLVSRPSALVPAAAEPAFFRLVRAGFSQKRKTLANALAATYRIPPSQAATRLRRARIAPDRRAQTLSLAEWERLLTWWEP